MNMNGNIDCELCTFGKDTRGVLTMAFVNPQPISSVYGLEDAWKKGTLFPCLDKPLLAGGKKYEC